MTPGGWVVEFHAECEKWAESLDQSDAEALLAAVRILRDHGPALGRPLVDAIHGGRHANMKELRPGSTGRIEIRVLFAFDAQRSAILLVGGDKRGNWSGLYATAIPLADERFSEHQATLGAQRSQPARPRGGSAGAQRRRRR
ncbi:hypothetical protein GCM10020218_064790 [Dactylosporangium vinaceum]|uniref:Type II toxin-antitoxin system RelE/ParE family toxin n=1 Tax=Dactylosporangium vinaceum TaxID=53362 RepID=A0ABV5M640_9ACTN|nr:type II toxin-antitoxin system RelE/ParE family toxin [Dactylosporangium vinaceum]